MLKNNDNEEIIEANIKGEFKIYLGNKLHAKGKNKWTRYFASSLATFVAQFRDGFNATEYLLGLSYNYTARAGKDTSTPTDPNMLDIVDKIDIAPDTQSNAAIKSSDYTKYQVKKTFVWNPGTIPPQIIGEFGVYLFLTDDSWSSPTEKPGFSTIIPYGDKSAAIPLLNADTRLGARISSGDGDFDPIDYSSEESIILEWFVTIKF